MTCLVGTAEPTTQPCKLKSFLKDNLVTAPFASTGSGMIQAQTKASEAVHQTAEDDASHSLHHLDVVRAASIWGMYPSHLSFEKVRAQDAAYGSATHAVD